MPLLKFSQAREGTVCMDVLSVFLYCNQLVVNYPAAFALFLSIGSLNDVAILGLECAIILLHLHLSDWCNECGALSC